MVGVVSRIPDGAMTPERVAARHFMLGNLVDGLPGTNAVPNPKVAVDFPCSCNFLAFSPTLGPPTTARDDMSPPSEECMGSAVDGSPQSTFSPIMINGYSCVTAAVADAEILLDEAVNEIKRASTKRVRDLADMSLLTMPTGGLPI